MAEESKKKKRSISNVFLALFFLGLIILVSLSSVPNFKKARRSARDKACYSNIRVLQGAVEMYNMDSSIMMDDLDICTLKASKYIKEDPVKPERSCEYYSEKKLSEDGYVFCRYHGDLCGNIEGDYYRDQNRINVLDTIRPICIVLGIIMFLIVLFK